MSHYTQFYLNLALGYKAEIVKEYFLHYRSLNLIDLEKLFFSWVAPISTRP